MITDTYHETKAAALDAVEAYLATKSASLACQQEVFRAAFDNDLAYGRTVRLSFDLLTFRGKETNKQVHVQLYRLDSGRYELNYYIA